MGSFFSEKVNRKTFLCHHIWYLNVPLPVPVPEPPAADLLLEVKILSPISHSSIVTSSSHPFPAEPAGAAVALARCRSSP